MDPRLRGRGGAAAPDSHHHMQGNRSSQQYYNYYQDDFGGGQYQYGGGYNSSSSSHYYQDTGGQHQFSNFQSYEGEAYYGNQQNQQQYGFPDDAREYGQPVPYAPSPPVPHHFQLPELPKNSITSIQSNAPSIEDLNLDVISVGKMVNILKQALKTAKPGKTYQPIDTSKLTASS